MACSIVVRRRLLPAALTLGIMAAGASALDAAGRVRLELVGGGRGSALVFQEWLRVLSRAGVKDVRIRAGEVTDQVGIEIQGGPQSPLYVVTGIVRSHDELELPSGRFRRRDAARLARWLDDLAKHGPEDQREPPGPFGLSARQFREVRRDAAQRVGFATRTVPRNEAVARIARRLTLPLQIDPEWAKTLGRDEVGEELAGLSCGTALAYVLRPLGLCLVLRRDGERPAYAVVKARPGMEVWPVGWEPEKPRRELVPAMFEFHNVNIQGVSAATVLEAIGKRLKIPILIDHNALARHGIDPAEVSVSHPRSRTTYSLTLRKILFQAGLKSEVRVDEAGQPFLWISTLKPI